MWNDLAIADPTWDTLVDQGEKLKKMMAGKAKKLGDRGEKTEKTMITQDEESENPEATQEESKDTSSKKDSPK